MSVLQLGPNRIDLAAQTWTRGEDTGGLSPHEVAVLTCLSARAGQVVSHDTVLLSLGYRPGVRTRAVHHVVTRLRKKLELDPAHPEWLLSVYGRGYRLVLPRQERRGVAASGLVGRDDDLERVLAALDAHRNLTLVGPAGIGKTSLARAVPWPGPSSWVEGRTATDRNGLLVALATSLQLPLTTARPEVEIASRLAALGDRLVVADNLEQLDEPAIELVSELLDAAPDLRWLSTSRRPLGSEGEHVLPLAPLELDGAARELFVARAREVYPTLELTPSRRAALDRIVAWSGGNPLAIELLAAQVRYRPLDDIALDGGQEALAAAVESSWSILEGPHREALAAAAAFVGPFTARDFEAVTARSAGVLAGLVEASLVRPTPASDAPRFVLEPWIRTFARERCEEPAAVGARWLAWLLAHPAQAVPVTRVADLEAALVDARGLELARLAVRYASAARDVGERGVLLEVLGRASAVPGLPPDLVRTLLLGRGSVLAQVGRPEEALAALDQALALCEDPASRAGAQLALGVVLQRLGRSEDAEGVLTEALTAAEGADRVSALRTRAAARRSLGELDGATRDVERALAALLDDGDQERVGVLCDLGILHTVRGRLDRAEDALAAAARLAEDLGAERYQGIALLHLGGVLLLAGDDPGSEARVQQARAIMARLGEVRFLAMCEVNLGIALAGQGRFAEGVPRLYAGLDGHRRAGDRRGQLTAAINLGEAALDVGDDDLLAHAVEILDTLAIDDVRLMGCAASVRAGLHLVRGELEAARAEVGVAWDRVVQAGDAPNQALVAARAAAIAQASGDHEGTDRWIAEALGRVPPKGRARAAVRRALERLDPSER